jgi:2,4-diaminopentanoate dehydrogenase
MQTIKIAQFGMGPIGIESLKLAATKPWVQIVGAVDIDPAKVGKSVKELAGIDKAGESKVYSSFEELWQKEQPQVVLHTAGSKAAASIEQITPMARRGVSVVSSCEELLYPYLRAEKETKELEQVCRENGARIVGTGVNPGFVLDLLPVCLTGVCRSVRGIYGERVVNASTRRGPLQKKIGSGMDPEEFRELFRQGKAGHAGFQESLALIGHCMNWKFDETSETCEPMIADHDIKTNFFEVKKGLTCGLHQRAIGKIGGKTLVELDLKMYLDAKDPHDLVRIDGDPPVEALLKGGVAGDSATVAALINAVPRVLRARPGVLLMTDLPVPAVA